jgi:F420-0:gamma-glutamyl ligase-like protein
MDCLENCSEVNARSLDRKESDAHSDGHTEVSSITGSEKLHETAGISGVTEPDKEHAAAEISGDILNPETAEKLERMFKPNPGKNLIIDTEDFGRYERYPVRTHVVMKEDIPKDVVTKYAVPYMQTGDTLFISEKIIAIMQNRAFPIDEIKVSWLARFLVRFVHKSDYGIGIGSPETMELCVREVGHIKILFAAFCSAICKLFGKRGVFYNICGMKARAIDGPCDHTIPPYNRYAKMAPDKPHEVAEDLAKNIGFDVIIIDANDIGVVVLGKSRKNIPDAFGEQVFGDNPLDQDDQQTPLAIVRKVTV